ncbi:MAG: metal ABC transporter permease [Planctomycetes bacterium]|nr:metal ABC transporter permease [Planctomycetota bacterium]
MVEFFQALLDPVIPFLRFAFIAGLLSSVSFGIIGSYVVVKRITYIASAIAHSVLGGIGLALYLQGNYGLSWFSPLLGATFAALLSALIIGFVTLYSEEREDSVIGAIWVTGMSTGVILLSQTPGYVEPMSYLFGDITLISSFDLWVILILDFIVISLGLIFYNPMLSVCFDEEFARLRGINTKAYTLLLLCLTALTVVVMMRIVGIVLVIALLTLPAAAAGRLSGRLWQMMALSTSICLVSTSSGLALSYTQDLPAGATIVLLAGAIYLSLMAYSGLRKMR